MASSSRLDTPFRSARSVLDCGDRSAPTIPSRTPQSNYSNHSGYDWQETCFEPIRKRTRRLRPALPIRHPFSPRLERDTRGKKRSCHIHDFCHSQPFPLSLSAAPTHLRPALRCPRRLPTRPTPSRRQIRFTRRARFSTRLRLSTGSKTRISNRRSKRECGRTWPTWRRSRTGPTRRPSKIRSQRWSTPAFSSHGS